MALGNIVMGLAYPAMLVPSLPEMIKQGRVAFPNEADDVNDLASGIFNSGLGVGQILGPIFGSYLTHAFNF
jgi:hypothetical protein